MSLPAFSPALPPANPAMLAPRWPARPPVLLVRPEIPCIAALGPPWPALAAGLAAHFLSLAPLVAAGCPSLAPGWPARHPVQLVHPGLRLVHPFLSLLPLRCGERRDYHRTHQSGHNQVHYPLHRAFLLLPHRCLDSPFR